MSNPLIAPVQDSTKGYSGISLAESAASLADGIKSGDWASIAMGVVGTALDALSAVMDPFGAILAAGVGWLLEHVGPLKEALNALTGDADQIAANSETWKNVASELSSVGDDLKAMVAADTASWVGDAGDAYRQRSADTVALLQAASKGCEGASSGVKTAGEVVGAVRTLVRDTIAQLVGHMISWALQVLFTLGIGLLWVVPEVISAVAKTAADIAKVTSSLVKALKALMPLLKNTSKLFEDAASALKGIKGGKAAPPVKHEDIGGVPKPPPSRSIPKDGETKASGDHTPPPPSKTEAPPPPETKTAPSGVRDDLPVTPPPTKAPPPPASEGGKTAPSGAGGGEHVPPLAKEEPNPRPEQKLRCEDDPIDVSSGQMVMGETDVEYFGALPLVIDRTHFSGRRAGRWFGSSWVSVLDQRLEAADTGLTFAAADGTIQKYRQPVAGEWVTSDQGPRRPLTRAEDGGYLMEDTEQGRVLYFAPGSSVLPLTSVTDRGGNRIEFGRDENGAPAEIRHSGGYTVRVETVDGLVTALHSVAADGTEVELMHYGYTAGQLTTVTNGSGQAFRYSYDAAARIVGWTDRNGEWYRYTYDHNGRCVRTEGAGNFFTGTMEYDTENRITYSTDSLGQLSEFHMNEAGQVVKEVDPLGNTIVNEWDSHDNLLRQTDALGRTTAYTYDAAGNVLVVTRPDGAEIGFERNEFGLPLTMVEAPGVITRWEYDASGYLTKVIDPTGAATSYTYDVRGNVSTVTDALGNTLSIQCDDSGLPTAATDARGGVTRYERDRFGRICSITDALGAVERFGYTVEGRVAWHQYADGTVERWIFDGEGNNRVYTDRAAAVTRSEVTHFDLPAAEIRPDGTRVEFAYDTRLRLTAVTNEQGLVWRYEYDAVGNLVREQDFAGAVVDYRYDAGGQVLERTCSGETTTFRYDLVGNVVEHTCGALTTRYSFSTTGHLLEVEDGHSRVSYQRDAVGRITAETVNGRTVESVYDALGRRVRRRTPSGAESRWEYDALDQPVAVHTPGRTLRFEHDLAGREVRRTLDTGTAISQAWTPNDLLSSQTITSATGQLSQQRSYAYRPDGLLAGVQDRLSGPRTFALDLRGRVTGVQASRWTERYAYDVAGNVTEAVWPAGTDQDALGHRSFDGTVIRTAGSIRYAHDDRGRLVLRESAGGGTWQYVWDPQDRLVGVRTPHGAQWRYSYDALGRRIAKERLVTDVTGGVIVAERIDFTWDDQVLVEQAQWDGNGTRVTVWDHEPDSFRPLIQRERLPRSPQEGIDERFYAIVADQAGAPMELVNEQGGIAWFARTSLWGHTVEGARTAADTPLRFPGQYFDAESGLHYNFFRYYDPAIGRYASPDPIGLGGGPNPHAYVDNPHAQVDPLGLAPGGCGLGGASGAPGGGGKRGANGKPKLTVNTNVPNNVVTAKSPGGRTYQQMSPGGKYGGKKPNGKNYTRREAAGYMNPDHMHGNMIPLWKNAATSPIPVGLKGPALKKWLADGGRHFQTHSPGGTDTGIIQGHSNGVLGHDPSASTHFNHHGGKEQPRDDNLAHNRETDTYHDIEDRKKSDASGSHEERYGSPGPEAGGDRAYWDRNDPRFAAQGGPWHSWQEIPGTPPGSSASSGGSSLTSLSEEAPTPKRPRPGSGSDTDD